MATCQQRGVEWGDVECAERHGGSRMGWLHSLPRVQPWDPSRLRTATRVIGCPLVVWMIVRCARLSLVSCGMRVQQSQAPASHVRPACARTGRELTVACVCALACPARARTGIGASREHAVRLRVGRHRARVPTQATSRTATMRPYARGRPTSAQQQANTSCIMLNADGQISKN